MSEDNLTLGEIRNRPNYAYYINDLEHMIRRYKTYSENPEAFTNNDVRFLDTLSRWIDSQPKPCYGYDLKTECGLPVISKPSGWRVGDVCEKCRDKHWQENPPTLSKREQNLINRLEALWKNGLPKRTSEDYPAFRDQLKRLWKRVNTSDHVSFHATRIEEKYRALAQQEEDKR